jgi:aspartate racemase
MKTIGLIGGMSWESSSEYYRIINETTKAKLGGLHSAKSLMYTVDFAEIEVLQRQDKWAEAAAILTQAAKCLELGGADFLVLCTNTMHKVVPQIQPQVTIPFLHIADPTAEQIRAHGLKRIGLLGTRFTMEQDFYKDRLYRQHGLEVLIPNQCQRDLVHRVIYEELCQGIINLVSKAAYVAIMDDLAASGAEGIILGCTEITLLVNQADSKVPLFDTTRIHAVAAVTRALQP